MKLEWQVAEGSNTAHVLDLDKPQWRNPDGSRRRNGPRAVCGRYPQRNAEGYWFGFPAAEWSEYRHAIQTYMIKVCPDCAVKAP